MLNVIVACTSGKRSTSAPIRLSMVSSSNRLETVFAKWIHLLQKNPHSEKAAGDLYKGDHWRSVMDSQGYPSGAPGSIKVWICSAGYGLVTPNTLVQPYSASFSSSSGDYVGATVVDQPDLQQKWWNLLTRWAGPEPGEPRSVAALVARTPDVPLLVALPPTYLEAISEDLTAARGNFSSDELLTILVSGSSDASMRQLSSHTVRLPKRLRKVFGGSDHALYGRTVKYIAANWSANKLTTSFIRAGILTLSDSTPEIATFNRVKRLDKEVQDFIKDSLLQGKPLPSSSALLRRYRGLGLACEQKRFSQLYKETRAEAESWLTDKS